MRDSLGIENCFPLSGMGNFLIKCYDWKITIPFIYLFFPPMSYHKVPIVLVTHME
jgi:hypothetical protein